MTDWMDRSHCAGMPAFLDLPSDQQKAICEGCPVMGECLELGIEVASSSASPKDIVGYGGLTADELWAHARPARKTRTQRKPYCIRGHVIAVVGRDKSGRCNACQRIRARDRDNDLRRERRRSNASAGREMAA